MATRMGSNRVPADSPKTLVKSVAATVTSEAMMAFFGTAANYQDHYRMFNVKLQRNTYISNIGQNLREAHFGLANTLGLGGDSKIYFRRVVLRENCPDMAQGQNTIGLRDRMRSCYGLPHSARESPKGSFRMDPIYEAMNARQSLLKTLYK
ncbi:uncharacterized protein BKA55DRAFT_531704 [Fusarium redolens]|uniref:Uncharacterized protein n=1 Tax=Fusarium redolens TaxID=48865 RepID=A0A9P9R802_FUSRE|nr:uncharacterized protein BKA55DRAFT_531704 [Fusarium redolens]KAH7269034.1 hypothetical protein BKA55DRAFT_531704 [Fusarium redolens]